VRAPKYCGKSAHQAGTGFVIECLVIHILILLLVLAGVGAYLMTAEERARILGGALIDARLVWGYARQHVWHVVALKDLEPDPYCERLRARTRRLVVTPTLMAAHILMFVMSGFGASLPTRAANGDWSLLLLSMLVHAGILQLVINLVMLFQLGFVLERLVGPITFAVMYFSSGLLAAMIGWTVAPAGVNVGASGAIFGMFGLLVACVVWLMRDVDGWKIPVTVLKTLAPAAGVFVLYNVLSSTLGFAAELTGFGTGLVGGLVLVKELGAHTPDSRPISIWSAVTLVVIAVFVVLPHAVARQYADVRPEIERVLALENYTAGQYEHAVDRFRKGRMTPLDLAAVIEQTIRPALQTASGRLKSLERVPPEHQLIVVRAQDYLRLRDESWRLRADALHKANMSELREADRMEQVSLEAFGKVRPPERQ
jgi:membrane associated rhomboid family serine protease